MDIADFVNPKRKYETVFIFCITKGLERESDNVYEATRKYWKGAEAYVDCNGMYAVGIDDYCSVGAFKIASWESVLYQNEKHKNEKRGAFLKAEGNTEELLNKNWEKIINIAIGYWQHGGYLIVQFDGNGKFRFKRGYEDKTSWFDCVKN